MVIIGPIGMLLAAAIQKYIPKLDRTPSVVRPVHLVRSLDNCSHPHTRPDRLFVVKIGYFFLFWFFFSTLTSCCYHNGTHITGFVGDSASSESTFIPAIPFFFCFSPHCEESMKNCVHVTCESIAKIRFSDSGLIFILGSHTTCFLVTNKNFFIWKTKKCNGTSMQMLEVVCWP